METDTIIGQETDIKTIKETNMETDTIISQETNKVTDIETNEEIYFNCELNKIIIYFRNEGLTYEEYNNETNIYSSTTMPLSLRLECIDKDLNKDEAQIKIFNAYMHGNKMRPINWEITASANLSEIYLDLDDSNKYLIEQLTTRIYDFTFSVKGKDNEETLINLKVNHIDTTINPFTPLYLDEWETTMDDDIIYSYANVKTQVGYYFSHDDEIRALGDKGGFNPEHVMEIEIFDVYKNNTEIKRNDSKIYKSWINFGKATPKKVFNSRVHNDIISIEDFKYEIPLMYGANPLINSDKEIINITAYIGLKGDFNLDLKVNYSDYILVFRKVNGVGSFEIGFNYEGNEIENLASFLCDVTENEYGINNWNKTERTLKYIDAQIIMEFFFAKMKDNNIEDNELWNKVLRERGYGV